MASPDGPWVRFFPSDWLAGTRGMTAAETGVYITLVCLMYEKDGPIPRDDARQARLCGLPVATYRKVIEVLVGDEKILEQDGHLINERVLLELKKRSDFSEAGRKAATVRWGKKDNENNDPKIQPHEDRNANPDANHNHNHNSSSSLRSLPRESEPDLDLAFGDWNTLAAHSGLPKATALTPKRKAALRQRLKECGGREGWQSALRMIPQSPFLMGENNTGFTATLDFVLQASSFTKLREGNYARRGGGPAPAPAKGLAAIQERLRKDIENAGQDGARGAGGEAIQRLPLLASKRD